MKKLGKRIGALLMVFVMVMSLAACGGTGSDNKGGSGEQVDSEKTQLYVFNYAGGFGAEWLAEAKARFEELHKDDVYEEGKKGIQIIINNTKTLCKDMQEQILSNKEEVYFTEVAYYYSLLDSGILADITDTVNKDLSVYGDGDKEGTTILDKLTEEQKAFLSVEKDGEAHYYGVPHYSGFNGLVYNVDLFEKEKYYFADNAAGGENLEDYFITKSTDKKSAGPDGVYDTYDDGLPVTFEEFYLLCDYIAENGHTPLTWRGASYDEYLEKLMLCMEANIEGKEQMSLEYSMNGVATTLGTANEKGFVPNAKSTNITAANGYELYRKAGKYYALEFLHKITTTEKYHGELVFNASHSHLNAQEEFLYAGHDNGVTAPIAMLVEGTWWENEASSVFESMTDAMGEDYARTSRKFAMMPLPRESKENTGKNVLYDDIYSMCFIKSNIEDWKKPIAEDFIAFVNTDKSLAEFTMFTNAPKALNYEMTDEQLSKMTYFGRSLIELKNNSDMAYPFSEEPIFVNQAGSYHSRLVWRSIVDGVAYMGAAQAFKERGISAADYFMGLYDYQKDTWKEKIY